MASFRSKMREKLGVSEHVEASPPEVEEEEITEDAAKREKQVVNILRKVRNKMIERHLEGSVALSVSGGLKSSSCSCAVSAGSVQAADDGDEEVNEKTRSAMSGVDRMLNNLGTITDNTESSNMV